MIIFSRSADNIKNGQVMPMVRGWLISSNINLINILNEICNIFNFILKFIY